MEVTNDYFGVQLMALPLSLTIRLVTVIKTQTPVQFMGIWLINASVTNVTLSLVKKCIFFIFDQYTMY